MIGESILKRIAYWARADRLGPDNPLTHWMLYFKRTAEHICKKKFRLFGKNSEFRPGAYAVATKKITIGNNVVIRPGTMLFADPREGEDGQIIIGDDVLIGSGVHIYCANHKHDDPNAPIIRQGHRPPQTTIIRTGAWLGANVILLPGVTVGENAVVGAGSIVTKDVPARTIVAGNPAVILKSIV